MAFLDIMPLSPGHLLVTTRAHREKVSEITDEEARELGSWLRRLSRVLAGVTGVWDWNIVQNNGMFVFFFLLWGLSVVVVVIVAWYYDFGLFSILLWGRRKTCKLLEALRDRRLEIRDDFVAIGL
jgi:hypothetical protein